jgi:hypothetical protein
MIRLISFAICVAAAVWLGLGSWKFRQSMRSSLKDAYSLMHRVDPEHAGDNGKVLNSYYEDVYRSLPATIFPACLLVGGATVLLVGGRRHKAEPGRATEPGPPLSAR